MLQQRGDEADRGAKGLHASEKWRERRAAETERRGFRRGPDITYKAGEILVSERDEGLVDGGLSGIDATPDEKGNALLARLGLPIRRWRVPEDTDVPAVLDELRQRFADVDGHAVPQVSVNHMVSGEPLYDGGPGDYPQLAEPLRLPPADRTLAATDTPQLAVLDTGVPKALDSWHPELVARLRGHEDAPDLLDEDGDDWLDFEAGHGTFICGLIQRAAPGLVVEPEAVLDSYGFGTDLGVAVAIALSTAPVLNLSLGGYTDGDRPPPATAAALRALDPKVVVVAAAGNHASSRPFWPAAFKRVIAVAAVDGRQQPPVPAGFSNHGWWVDVCAPGVDLRSTYVRGKRKDGDDERDFAGWATWSGTSFAAPLVAARIARDIAHGQPGPVAAAAFLAGLPPLPGHPDLGRYFDPATDLG